VGKPSLNAAQPYAKAECFFRYRPTRVVPEQRPLNGCCCCIKNTAVASQPVSINFNFRFYHFYSNDSISYLSTMQLLPSRIFHFAVYGCGFSTPAYPCHSLILIRYSTPTICCFFSKDHQSFIQSCCTPSLEQAPILPPNSIPPWSPRSTL